MAAGKKAPKCFGKKATMVVTGKRARGTKRRDVIVVKRKKGAKLNGRGGNDLICGGPGRDVLRGGPGNDRIRGGRGNDVLHGGPGNDRLLGGPGADRLIAGGGRDVLLGQRGIDRFDTKGSKATTTDARPGEIVDGKRVPERGTTELASVDAAGGAGNGSSNEPSISADGRYVTFLSSASNLVPDDTNGFDDVFVYHRVTGAIERVSVTSAGDQANHRSLYPSISADGRYVVFSSFASNLVPGDTNGAQDVFVHDRAWGTTERVSVQADGSQSPDWSDEPSISDNGRFVAFRSGQNLVPGATGSYSDIYVYDRATRSTELASVNSAGIQSNSNSQWPSISADGRYVAFESFASNLADGGDGGVRLDIFVRDRVAGATERVSVSSAGVLGDSQSSDPSISADGRYVAFESTASNLVEDDTNDSTDIFVHDREAGATERVSVSLDGSQSEGSSSDPSISADGRYVAFMSNAANLVPGDDNERGDVFVFDRQTGVIELVSVSSNGIQGDELSWKSSISADGRHVAFESRATTLVPGSTNEISKVFVHERGG